MLALRIYVVSYLEIHCTTLTINIPVIAIDMSSAVVLKLFFFFFQGNMLIFSRTLIINSINRSVIPLEEEFIPSESRN
jgi:hypothetical protein